MRSLWRGVRVCQHPSFLAASIRHSTTSVGHAQPYARAAPGSAPQQGGVGADSKVIGIEHNNNGSHQFSDSSSNNNSSNGLRSNHRSFVRQGASRPAPAGVKLLNTSNSRPSAAETSTRSGDKTHAAHPPTVRYQPRSAPTSYKHFSTGATGPYANMGVIFDYCFHVDLKRIPSPPVNHELILAKEQFNLIQNVNLSTSRLSSNIRSQTSTLKNLTDAGHTEGGAGNGGLNVLTMSDFVKIIPPFFIPVDALLSLLPGYTVQHIETYFSRAKAVQLVSIQGRDASGQPTSKRFIRFFGGYSLTEMDPEYRAAQLFSKYSIDPKLAEPFVRAFGGRRNTWMPLRLLLERAGKEAELALPYQGAESLLYFAQMQHIFAFASDNGGAVQLREDNYSKLTLETSPVPAAMVSLFNMLGHEKHDLNEKLNSLHPNYKKEILNFFPSLLEGVRRHSTDIHIEGDSVIMKTRKFEREMLKTLPAEKQLEIAIANNDKKRIRQLRKKIAMKNNPDNPLLDKDNLAREVLNYIPKSGFVTLTNLTRRVLPTEYLDLIGVDYLRFFRAYPQYFQIYELGYATRWCISRVGVPLPAGVLRTDYTEAEVLRIIAATVQRKGSTPCSIVMLTIPHGCREFIKRNYTTLYFFAAKYPQYFSLLITSETENKTASAMVSLIKMPLDTDDDATTSGGATGA